ncbi:MAG: MarR family winged helix-turn-helix transcriptional regulator [Flavobacteriaceae bacterium]|nr:MarR family winged helix-turn-helix transcriptional regulator [Flavobacteriaceae bacterium]
MSTSIFDLTAQNQQTDLKIIAALERITQAFKALLQEESNRYKLSPIQLQTLLFINFHSSEKCTVSYLAEEFNVTKATISDAIKSLYAKALVIKTPNKTDARSYRLALTEKGIHIADKAKGFTEQMHHPITAMEEAEKSVMLHNLLEIIRHMFDCGVISKQRMCFSCRFYKPKNGESYCELLKQNLSITDLRLDCPEYEQAS